MGVVRVSAHSQTSMYHPYHTISSSTIVYDSNWTKNAKSMKQFLS